MLERLLCKLLPHKDVVQGGLLYLRRFYLSPKLFGHRLFLHHIIRSDDDRAPHTHPFAFTSLILRGSYRERQYTGCYNGCGPHLQRDETYFVGDVLRRTPDTCHILTLERPCWTLVIVGPTVKPWGFLTPTGWIEASKYLKSIGSELI